MKSKCLLILLLVAVLVPFIIAPQAAEPVPSPTVIRHVKGPRHYLSEITKVVDGDTIYVRFKVWADITLDKKIRFDDIDTWETRGDNKDKGLAAKKFIAQLLEKGDVYLRTEGKIGKYGRTLGSLHVIVDGKMINVSEELRKNGHEKK